MGTVFMDCIIAVKWLSENTNINFSLNKKDFPAVTCIQGLSPFPAFLSLLSEPLLALLVFQSDKVPVVVNQKILKKVWKTDWVSLKPKQNRVY